MERNSYLEENGLTGDVISNCLINAHLDIIKNDWEVPYAADYTRLAAFRYYNIENNWEEDDFIPEGKKTKLTFWP